MPPALAATTRAQAGVFTLAQAEAAGSTLEIVRGWQRRRLVHRVHPGVYVVVGSPCTPQQRAWVAVLACGADAALAGETAIWWLGLRDVVPPVPQVAVESGRDPRTPHARVRRLARWDEVAIDEVDGMRVLALPDAIVTSAATMSEDELLVLIQRAAFERGLDPENLLLHCRQGLPGGRRLRGAVDIHRHGFDSPGERDIFTSLHRLHLPPDHCNIVLVAPDGRRTTPLDGYFKRGLGYDYDGRAAHAGYRASRRDQWKTTSTQSLGVELLRLDGRHRASPRLLEGAVREGLARVRHEPDLTVEHLPGRSCVCGWRAVA